MIWRALKISKCYIRYLKYGSTVTGSPVCALRTACVRRRRSDGKG